VVFVRKKWGKAERERRRSFREDSQNRKSNKETISLQQPMKYVPKNPTMRRDDQRIPVFQFSISTTVLNKLNRSGPAPRNVEYASIEVADCRRRRDESDRDRVKIGNRKKRRTGFESSERKVKRALYT